MRHLHFGRKSERREGNDDSPLFSLFAQLSAAGVDNDEEVESKPKSGKKAVKRGRTPQPKLAERKVLHTVDSKTAEARGLKEFEGQFEESTMITVVPSKIVLETHRRQNTSNGFRNWNP